MTENSPLERPSRRDPARALLRGGLRPVTNGGAPGVPGTGPRATALPACARAAIGASGPVPGASRRPWASRGASTTAPTPPLSGHFRASLPARRPILTHPLPARCPRPPRYAPGLRHPARPGARRHRAPLRRQPRRRSAADPEKRPRPRGRPRAAAAEAAAALGRGGGAVQLGPDDFDAAWALARLDPAFRRALVGFLGARSASGGRQTLLVAIDGVVQTVPRPTRRRRATRRRRTSPDRARDSDVNQSVTSSGRPIGWIRPSRGRWRRAVYGRAGVASTDVVEIRRP